MPDTTRDAALQDAAHWVGLSQISGLGSRSYRDLLSAFGTPEQIYQTPQSNLSRVVSPAIARLIAEGPDQQAIAPSLAWLAEAGNHLVTLADAAYPQALLEISDPPPLLYAKGRLDLLNVRTIAIVGSRNATPQGLKDAEAFAQALSEAGYCIASGLALGIDGAAHHGALRGQGSTIAAVGTGLDIVYPARHRQLAHQISQQGVLISEFPIGTPSMAQNFPRRNRLISGLSLGCLVVEAHLQSGSLITARLAAEQGREVFAIPGSIHSPVSKGCHRLIKQGAKLVETTTDILEELGDSAHVAAIAPAVQDAPQPLLELMGHAPIGMDALIERSGLTSENLSAMLLMLELDGKVASLPGGRYQRIS